MQGAYLQGRIEGDGAGSGEVDEAAKVTLTGTGGNA